MQLQLKWLRLVAAPTVAVFVLGACADMSGSTAPVAGGKAPSLAGTSFSGAASSGVRSGGGSIGGGGTTTSSVDKIRINKHSYDVGSHELLVSGSSSDANAHLLLYSQSGAYLGEVQNGGGGQYGGTVFVTLSDPVTVTIRSSSGGTASIATVPFVP
jgi:hypothetical protein